MNQKKGLRVVIAAAAIQLVLGTAYIWSVFQTGIADSLFGGNNAEAALTFSLLIAMLTLGSVIGGKLTIKYSTRIVVFIGGIILSLGFFLAGFVTDALPQLLWLTYGIMGGLGMGFTYSTTIACAQKWYPHKKGLVTGVIVASLGFGGVVFTPIVESLIGVFGGIRYGEQPTFMVLSGIFLVIVTAGSVFLKNPPPPAEGSAGAAAVTANANEIKNYLPSEMLKSPKFYLVTGIFLLACMSGQMMMAFARPIAVGKGLVEIAVIGVLAVTMFNSIGRMFWGLISDKLGRKNTIIILLFGTAGLPFLLHVAQSYWVFVIIALIGFFFGGFVSNIPALVADLFGPKHMSTNYGFVLLGFGAGTIVSSQIAGYFVNLANLHEDIAYMFPAFFIASLGAAVSIVLMLILKRIRRREGHIDKVLWRWKK